MYKRPKVYSTEQAAAALGLALTTVKHHIYKSRKLQGQLIGKTLVFTDADLAHFHKVRHQPNYEPGEVITLQLEY